MTKKAPKQAATVVPMKPADVLEVEPLAGWVLHSRLGHMAYQAGSGARLVRLADVLRWLQSSRELPRAAAVEAFCDAMPGDVMDWLYQLDGSGYAAPFDRQAMLLTWVRGGGAKVALAVRNKFGVDVPFDARSTLVSSIRSTWVDWARTHPDALDHPRSFLTLLAVPLYRAHQAWGWGRVDAASSDAISQPADWPSLVQHRKAHAGSAWEAWQLVIAHDEWRHRGNTVPTRNAMASELGVSRQSFAKTMMAEDRKRGRAKPGAGTGNPGGGTRKQA
jgi:hypothetical protein